MLRTLIIIPFLYLSGCFDLSEVKIGPNNLDSKNYTSCAVLHDYLVERRRTSEEPKTIVTDSDLKTFHYVAPTPIWNGVMRRKNSPDTARKALIELRPIIETRIDATIADSTFKAYATVQEDIFEPAKCSLPPYIYNKNDGMEIVNTRAKHNKKLNQNFVQTRDERLEHDKNFNRKELKALREYIYQNRKPYMQRKFSRIGINQKDKQAFFYTEYYCGRECAGGEYVLMELIEGIWKMTARYEQWVS